VFEASSKKGQRSLKPSLGRGRTTPITGGKKGVENEPEGRKKIVSAPGVGGKETTRSNYTGTPRPKGGKSISKRVA